ncbi:MAG: hypothetical protein J6U97_06755 [Bacteroidaceae bacterium]|nr:hypothetical protein [Bacteroidaceae bacterium]
MSIFGNPITLGGSGSTPIIELTDGVIHVLAPADSIVTISKGTVTESFSGLEHVADDTFDDYYFIIKRADFNATPWTVEATLGNETATEQVVVNYPGNYDIEMSFRNYIYKAGDTGGWTNIAWKDTSSHTATAATSISFANDKFTITQGTSHSSITYHDAKVDLTEYSTLTCDVYSWNANADAGNGLYILSSVASTTVVYPSAAAQYQDKVGTGSQLITIDISALNGEYYVAIGTVRTGSINTVATINSIYLQ